MPRPLPISATEIATAFAAEPWASQFPPVLTIVQFARMMQVSRRTVFQWLAADILKNATFCVGRQRRILRDRALATLAQTHS